ncbi:MAG: orotidine-5'-phosphate decarboxylase [Pseudomonadota bacterium]
MTDQDDRLIISLDVPTALDALNLVNQIGDAGRFYKVGLGMLTGGGLALADELKSMGKRVFLDMKLFDIPATIQAAVAGLTRYDIDFLTVHGDPHVVAAAAAGRGDRSTRILAVTFLTSLDRSDLDLALIRPGNIGDLVTERARLALLAGADGVIASAEEARTIRALPEAEGRLIVTPGIRPLGAARDDQKRIATPAGALNQGADHIVVGRPIHRAADPRAAATAILSELPQA